MTFAPLVLGWRLTPGASLAPIRATDLALTFAGNTATLSPGHGGLRDALLALKDGADETHLTAVAGDEKTAELYYYLAGMVRRGVLEASADLDGSPIVRLVPRSSEFELPLPSDVPQSVMLDRFAFLRRAERGATVQHPDAACDLLIEHAAVADLVGRLAAGPLDAASLSNALDRAVVSLLAALGFAVDAAAPEDVSRRAWEFHDRLFQRAARSYADLVPRGATYRFVGELPAAAAIRPAYSGASISLAKPQVASGRSMLEVMEGRRSSRAMSDTPVSLDAVSSLLYRVARVKGTMRGPPEMPQDLLLRPYPSGGAIHELEFYLAVHACDGLAPGFYHYRGQEHALTRIVDAEAPAAAMLDDCAAAWGQPGRPPQVLVVIASRLPRLAWKYSGIAYKISLMNAGVAIHSLYLVANDLGLAGAAAGSGNPELFARATGVSSWEETSIAEFGFGRPA
jgi:SagB-type dehydrogenase family enzyme